MARLRFALPLVMLIVGCDHASEYAECDPASDPTFSPGRRAKQCPMSEYAAEDIWAREVYGKVFRGIEGVPGALVRIDRAVPGPSPFAPLTTVTDATGFFAGVREAPLRYDIAARFDAEVILYRGASKRYFELAIDTPTPSFGRAWTAGVDIAFDRPTPPGHSIVYFATGTDVFSASGDTEHGLTVHIGKYSTPAILLALEYETAGGLQKATAWARSDITVDAGERRFAPFVWAPITSVVSPKFVAKSVPPGFVLTSVDVSLHVSSTSGAHLATAPANGVVTLPVIPFDHKYRATAKRADGAIVDTGEIAMAVDATEIEYTLEPPPVAVSPADGETRGPEETLVASGKGIFEHVLVSQTNGPTVRIVTRSLDPALPDVKALGAAAAVGPYTWTVRAYPNARFVEDLAGYLPRRYQAMTVAPPRTINLR